MAASEPDGSDTPAANRRRSNGATAPAVISAATPQKAQPVTAPTPHPAPGPGAGSPPATAAVPRPGDGGGAGSGARSRRTAAPPGQTTAPACRTAAAVAAGRSQIGRAHV